MDPLILFRVDNTEDSKNELQICKKYFNTTTSRVECKNNLVIGRYSVLPFYKELENDLHTLSSKLINSYRGHCYIANFEWYHDLESMTFKTYFDHDFYLAPEDKYVLKGKTNSCKFSWNTKMFAKSKKDAILLGAELSTNQMLGPQGIIYRQYRKLKSCGEFLNGLQQTKEFRFFFYKECLLSYGYYWSNGDFIPDDWLQPDKECINTAIKAAKILAENVDFFVVDVGQTEDNEYIVIEVNDGQMSGLSLNDPDTLYKNLKDCING